MAGRDLAEAGTQDDERTDERRRHREKPPRGELLARNSAAPSVT